VSGRLAWALAVPRCRRARDKTGASTSSISDSDALDSIVAMTFGNLALDLILRRQYGPALSIHRGFGHSVSITSVTSDNKVVDVKQYYNTEQLRPTYEFDSAPLFILTSDRPAVSSNTCTWASRHPT
jgi:hypothetical protein